MSYGLWPPEVRPGYRPKLRPTYSRIEDCKYTYSALILLFLEQIRTLLETYSSLERQINELLW